jgi:hypothetical protein
MRPIFLFLFLIPFGVKSQCSSHVKVAYAYLQPGGGGVEVGFWPVESRIGGYLGAAITAPRKQSVAKATDVQYARLSGYLKGQLRFNQYVSAIVIAGAYQMDEGYLAAGLRACYPFQERQRFAVIGEATYGTTGPNFNLGVGISLE